MAIWVMEGMALLECRLYKHVLCAKVTTEDLGNGHGNQNNNKVKKKLYTKTTDYHIISWLS